MGESPVIILTGASGGIGQELIDYLRNIDEVLGIYHLSQPQPCTAGVSYVKLNIEDEDAIAEFVENWRTTISKITLIHCAGVNIDGLAANYSLQNWDQVLGVNLRGNFALTQALLPNMIKDRWGRILHFSSHIGLAGIPGTIAYSASKTGLIGMSRVLASEYSRFNITSNILVLGVYNTGMYHLLPDEQRKALRRRTEFRKFGDIANIANAIEHLIHSDSDNGKVINV